MSTYTTGQDNGTITTAAIAQAPTRFFSPAPIEERQEVTSPDAAAGVLGPLLYGLDREGCAVAYLDTKHRVLASELLSLGSIDHTFMAPRDVFRGALLVNASALIIAHNHPSGDPAPSRDDELVTRNMVRAGEIVGVDVLDHLVIAGEQWVSLSRRGLLA